MERDDSRREAAYLCPQLKLMDESLVTAVNAVELSYRYGSGSMKRSTLQFVARKPARQSYLLPDFSSAGQSPLDVFQSERSIRARRLARSLMASVVSPTTEHL